MADPVPTHGAQGADDAQRFAEQMPDWVSGQLPAPQAQWMTEMAAQHPDWAEEAQWMRDFRDKVQQHARDESTGAAWALLQRRLQVPAATTATAAETALWQRRRQNPKVGNPPAKLAHRARLQRWWRSPMWGNALASVALAVALGHTAWQLLGTSVPDAEGEPPGAAWRAVSVEDLAVAAAPVWQATVQLPAATSASQWHSAVLALGSGVQVQPLPDGRWQLQLPHSQTAAQWRVQLLAQPGLGQAQWHDVPAGTAAP